MKSILPGLPEGPYVLPASASTLGIRPYLLRQLVFPERGISSVRFRHVGGRLLIRLADVQRAARTRSDRRTKS